MSKHDWKKIHAEAEEAQHGKSYTGKLLHVVPSRRKHESGFHLFVTYLIRYEGTGYERQPRAIKLYTTNDMASFDGPVQMDVPRPGILQFWAPEKNLRATVLGFSSCIVKVVP